MPPELCSSTFPLPLFFYLESNQITISHGCIAIKIPPKKGAFGVEVKLPTMTSPKLRKSGSFVHSGNDQNHASVTFNIILKIPIEIHKEFKST